MWRLGQGARSSAALPTRSVRRPRRGPRLAPRRNALPAVRADGPAEDHVPDPERSATYARGPASQNRPHWSMLVTAHMTLTEVRDCWFEVVDRLEREHGRVAITKHGRPVAVLLSVDDLESLEATLDVLSDARLTADIREALSEGSTTPPVRLTKDEALGRAADR